MGKIDELIEKLCPNGVEYKKTKELKKESFWLMPSTPNYISNGIPYITSKNIRNGKIDFEDVNYISQEDYVTISMNRKIEKNDLLVTMIGTIGETAFVEEYTSFYGQNMYLIRLDDSKINRKFYNYYLTSPKIKNSLISRKNTSSQGYIKAGSLEELLVPVPPLEVQCEIVRVLDDFAEYIDCLDMELKCREKQLEYVMKKELNTDNFKKFTILDELCRIEKGKTALQKATPGKYPLVATTEYLQSCDNYQFDCEAVCMPLISARGHGVASITRIFYQKGKFALGNILCAIIPRNNVIKAEFLRHYLYYYKDIILVPLMTGGANVSLTTDTLKSVKVAVPSIEEQERIICKINKIYEILDKEYGLPAEIEARQKQYEYYRDKLLTFKELKEN